MHPMDEETRKPIRVLAVDDDPVALVLYDRVLGGRVDLETHSTAESALESFLARRADVLLLDWLLPGMDGVELAARIRELPDTEDIQILIVTGRNEADNLQQALNSGANDYLEKPVFPEQLRVRLEISIRNLELRNRKKESERKGALMLQVFDNSLDGIVITDRENCIIYTNEAFSRITGYSADEALGQTPAFLSSGFHSDAFYRQLWEAIVNRGSWKGEIWNKRKSGDIYPEWLEISTVRNEEKEITHYIAHFSDISQKKQNEEQLRYLASYDTLTGLPNRSHFMEILERSLMRARESGERGSILFLDLDRFQVINDTLSHGSGDLLLRQVSERLRGLVGATDTLSRTGGDEFAILIETLTGVDHPIQIVESVMEEFNRPFQIEGQEIYVSASVGICIFPDDASDGDTLLRNVDMAMYRAKETGRNTYHFYSPEINTRAFEHLALEASLRRAIERREFLLHFQPLLDAKGKRTVACEALVRWEHPELGMVSPARFIPMAEETGLIVPMGRIILEMACSAFVELKQLSIAPDYICVNVSARQFFQDGFLEMLDEVLQSTGMSSENLELELTESVFIQDVNLTLELLNALRSRNVRLAIDDFGTGFSSLSYLKRFPVDTLKIDQSFVRDIHKSEDDMAIVRAIIALAHVMRLTIVAEGVETEEQSGILEREGCDILQGYLYSRPLPLPDFHAFLTQATFR
ncbi:MAG: EAL domain-containing protein [Leptospiraceae bacterium]|nr:EAL domain-containing protein [Leptospiraceae bacterium]